MPSPTEMVCSLVKILVDQPDQVQGRWLDSGQVELKVARQDRGKVIGRKGRTIQSLRLLATAAFGQGKTIGVELAKE